MKTAERKILIILAAVAGLILFTMKPFESILKSFLPSVEGFSPYPVWDFKQWSWGFGTAAGYNKSKKPAGSITKEQAWLDALKVITAHYNYLKPLVKVELNPKQWAALLSFSYNLGSGTAAKIVQTINTGTAQDVVTRMKKYVYADGEILQGLVTRRKKETELYLS